MKFWIDTEFNGYRGELISMALVTEDGYEFYEVLRRTEEVKAWVGEHVIPILGKTPISRAEFQRNLQSFLCKYMKVHLIADWPDDLRYFCEALITGPGTALHFPTLTMEIARNLDAVPSSTPHNALADARAIKASHLLAQGKEGEKL